jgi:hypothetical protein
MKELLLLLLLLLWRCQLCTQCVTLCLHCSQLPADLLQLHTLLSQLHHIPLSSSALRRSLCLAACQLRCCHTELPSQLICCCVTLALLLLQLCKCTLSSGELPRKLRCLVFCLSAHDVCCSKPCCQAFTAASTHPTSCNCIWCKARQRCRCCHF